jgi:hypothetical protein
MDPVSAEMNKHVAESDNDSQIFFSVCVMSFLFFLLFPPAISSVSIPSGNSFFRMLHPDALKVAADTGGKATINGASGSCDSWVGSLKAAAAHLKQVRVFLLVVTKPRYISLRQVEHW